MATKSRYVANVPILHSGTRFAIGDPLALTAAEAASMGSAVTAQAGALPVMPADPLVPAMIPAGSTAVSTFVSAQGVVISADMSFGKLSVPYSVGFTDFAPSIISALAVSSTVSQSDTTVTVTVGGASPVPHGITAAKNGYRYYYPGSASIPAGWYMGWAYVSASVFSFTAPAPATVAVEPVNSGAIFTATVTVCNANIPGGMFVPNGRLSVTYMRSGDVLTGARALKLLYGGAQLGQDIRSTATTAYGTASITIHSINSTSQICAGAVQDFSAGSSGAIVASVDQSLDKLLTLSMGVAASQQWMSLDSAKVDIK